MHVTARTLDLTLLRTFVAVVEKASMTAAANAMNLTQGAVSQQVRRLEGVVGCSLLVRDRRHLRLTTAGERLFGQARRILRLNDEIWADIKMDAVEGRVRLGVPPDLVGAVLAPVLKAYAEAFPRVELVLVCAPSPELLESMSTGLVDLAIAEEAIGASQGECLAVERLVWVGAEAGTAHEKRPLPLSMVASTCAFRAIALAALDRDGIGWRTVFEGGSVDATVATVRADLSVSAWMASIVPPGLEILPPTSRMPSLPNFAINLHAPSDGAIPVAALAQTIRSTLGRFPLTPGSFLSSETRKLT